MGTVKKFKIHLLIVLAAAALMITAAASLSLAASVPDAKGQINSIGGAELRQKSSANSASLGTLANDTYVTIHKEIFKKAASTAASKKWYYVTANGKKGYVRSDLVDNISYGSVAGKAKVKAVYRKGAGTGMKKKGSIKKGRAVTVVLKAKPVSSASGSSKTWYKILKGDKYYYVSSANIKITGQALEANTTYTDYRGTAMALMSSQQFESYLTDQGFPETYKTRLRDLHALHPNWTFVGYNTGIDWSAALSKQTASKVSLVYKSYPSSYRSSDKQVESGWYNASSKVVAYFMDPRNFINEDRIYMFEDLSYKPEYQTAGVVQALLSPTQLPRYGFTADLFVNAGAAYNISPIFLASRARQETGGGGIAINGQSLLGSVYNPFNIGASGKDPLYEGLVYAKACGWDTPEKSINGGAKILAERYISKGQHTSYYQRFNVRNGAAKVGTHQYMTNIMAPYQEASTTRSSYTAYAIQQQALVFEIPIYTSMPDSTSLP